MPKVFRIKSSLAYDPAVTLDGGGNGILRFTTKVADTLVVANTAIGISRFEIASNDGDTQGRAAANLDISAVAGVNTLIGNDGDNILTGGVGTKAIIGNGGSDTAILNGPTALVRTGRGDDTLVITNQAFIAPGAVFDLGRNGVVGDTLEFVGRGGATGSAFDISGATLIGVENLSANVSHIERGGPPFFIPHFVSGDQVTLGSAQMNALHSMSADSFRLADNGAVSILAGVAIGSNGNPESILMANGGQHLTLAPGVIAPNLSIRGGTGDDIISAAIARVLIDAGLGNDSITVRGDNATVLGNKGNDLIDGRATTTGFQATGGEGQDTIFGGSGSDTFRINGSVELAPREVMDGVSNDPSAGDLLFLDATRQGELFDLSTSTVTGIETLFISSNFFSLSDSADADVTLTAGQFSEFQSITAHTVNLVGPGAAIAGSGDLHVDTINMDGSGISLDLTAATSITPAGTHQLFVNGGAGGDTIKLLATTGPDQGYVVNSGGGDDNVTGGNVLNILNGGDGNDNLSGGNQSDLLSGDAGNDTLQGGAGGDNLDGGSGNDLLQGGDSLDFLDGGAGDDILDGGAGPDRMTGGAGSDKFVFTAASDSGTGPGGRDFISDFTHAQDHLDFTQFDANPTTAGLDRFALIGDTPFSNTVGELRFTNNPDPALGVNPGNALIEGDVNGDGIADFQIVVAGTLTATDFLL